MGGYRAWCLELEISLIRFAKKFKVKASKPSCYLFTYTRVPECQGRQMWGLGHRLWSEQLLRNSKRLLVIFMIKTINGYFGGIVYVFLHLSLDDCFVEGRLKCSLKQLQFIIHGTMLIETRDIICSTNTSIRLFGMLL